MITLNEVDERLLFVEDDPAILALTAHGLEQAGFDVTTQSDGRQALIESRSPRFDAVILDVMLPSLDGIEVCRQIRRFSGVPILMLTARSETMDVVLGLEAGADDYVTKPFELPELVARLRAVLRRTGDGTQDETLHLGDLRIEPQGFKAFKKDEDLKLTAMEFRLLLELARHPGQVYTREVLLERVWDYDYLGDSRLVDMAIKRLRSKIEDDPGQPKRIQTVRGVGYRFERP